MRRFAGAWRLAWFVLALAGIALGVWGEPSRTWLVSSRGEAAVVQDAARESTKSAKVAQPSAKQSGEKKAGDKQAGAGKSDSSNAESSKSTAGKKGERPGSERGPGERGPGSSSSPKQPNGEDGARSRPGRDEESPAVRLIDDPDNLELLRRFVGDEMRDLTRLIQEDPAQATARIAELKQIFAKIEPTKRQVVHELGHAKASLSIYEKQVAYSQISLSQAAENWRKRPEDTDAIGGYFAKLTGEIYKLARDKPAAAGEQLKSARDLIAELEPRMKSESAKRQLRWSTRSLDRLEGVVTAGERLRKVVGEEAIPLQINAWVHGAPVTQESLKGKVVLLAFWAVWSSPCVSTFPRLCEWHERYEDKGLMVVGITRYYNFRWDERAKRANRGFGMVSRESERDMLDKFSAHHHLPFVVGVQESGGSIGKHYGVIELPHFVVIDRDGKVRLAKGGSDPRVVNEVDKLLVQLMAAP